jgi:hypothetical protein
MERAVLDYVPSRPHDITSGDIARKLFGKNRTEAQLRSMRRAIASLVRKGLVQSELKVQPTLVRDVVASDTPGRGYLKFDRGVRLGHAVMHTLTR